MTGPKTGGRSPPPGLPKTQLLAWVNIQVRAKNRLYLLFAYLATLSTLVLVTALGVYYASHPVPKDKPPVLIDSTVTR